MSVRILTAALMVLCACERQPQSGPPARLVSGRSDTIVVNSRYPMALAVRALDAEGRGAAAGATISYAWVSGDSFPITPTGDVTCTKSGDAVVRAALGSLSTRLVVLCRLVEYVSIPGPLQFVLGDSALSRPFELPLVAYDTNGRPISPVVASILVKDSAIAVLRGRMLFPRARGITVVGAHVGARDAGIGVHIYQRVHSLASLDTLLRLPDVQRLFAVPIQLNPGELRRQHLPPGGWMLTMMPETDSAPDRIHLRVEGARCQDHIFNSPRRWNCATGPDATVVLYRPSVNSPTREATGYLLVRWLFM
jgi:hypothetical protein